MSHDIELKLHSVADAHESVKRRGSFHFEVAAVDAEFSLRAKIISRYDYLGRNRYRPRHSVQRQISSDLQVELIVRRGVAGDTGAAENDLRILVRLEDDFAQFFVDDLFLRFRKDAAGFDHRSCLRDNLERRSRDQVRIKSDPAGEIANGDQMIVTLEPKQAAGQSMRNELALRSIKGGALKGIG